jgi:CheY-like chemotaxis protein
MACSILIVDQEPETRAFLRTLLTNHGFIVHCARGVEDGTCKKQSCCPDLMIVDAMLPEEGALSFCGCDITPPVIFISPIPLKSLFFRNRLLHAHNGLKEPSRLPYLEKPLQEDELLYLINTLNRPTGSTDTKRGG